ncbi:ATPase [Ktedonobacteria bacterium brp13]|nr:ATPase [Ktedonobacteria bacterium brp13]
MSANKANVNAEPGKQEILITREFDAPRELVFKACTDPQLVAQWWGPRRLSTYVDKMDVRPGGQWRFINRDAEGNEYAFHGVYHEILAPERIIDTFEFEGLPETGHVTLETMRLEALPGGRTRLTTQSVYQSIADRDATLQSGMEEGLNETYERLAEVLQAL